MSENRTSKYLKYAIGEVLLVMIGILLAFQVNNWRDQNLASKEEKKIISLLKEGLKYNYEGLEIFQSQLKVSGFILG